MAIPKYQRLYNQLKEAYQRGEVSLGDIQVGAKVTRHTRIGSYSAPNMAISSRQVRTPATRIPAYVVNKFFTGQWTPKPATMKKLASFYESRNYNVLREAGYKKEEAKQFSVKPIHIIVSKYSTRMDYAKIIADKKGVPLEYVIRGMMDSKRKSNQAWDSYVRAKKYI